MDKEAYLAEIAASRPDRIRWWQEARFGMFVHWGLYSQIGRHEWVMNRERIPIAEYEPLADAWKPKERPAREWAALAKQAGMKYMVMTTKHHEGFCLWDTQMTDYNAAKRGPGRDLVREYVEACREFDLKIGFYYSLMDWHHPDGAACAVDEAARRRFLDYTQGLVRELMTNYGKIDILWYDVSWPLKSPELWESVKMSSMARELQPHIIINNRDQLDEDFGTPEEHVTAEQAGRNWEACMTFNGAWGYMPSAPDEDWHSTRAVLGMLSTATAGQGNLLLNIGPAPDGSVPQLAYDRLLPVGKWLAQNGEAVYGQVDRTDGRLEWMPVSGNPMGRSWTLKGNTAYFWIARWPGRAFAIGGLKSKLLKASILASGQPVEFEQQPDRVLFRGLPEAQPDEFAGTSILKLEFVEPPRQALGAGCVVL
ncbi:MAG: Alpha-L-fucosidase [Chloroflexi bacterium ADurb.Bin325]|nr:MAG: Alpha-L-fucosidase [Chloroflexi bacterium ADurb.Bin325]